MPVVEVIARTDTVADTIEQVAPYLWRGWRVDTTTVQATGGGWSTFDIVADGYTIASAEDLAGRLQSGLFGAKVRP